MDVASAPMAGTTSQVPASALVAALENTERSTTLDLRAVMDLEPYWEAMRNVYKPFESGLPSPTGRVYDHEIPGGQLSNLRQQAIALGLGRSSSRSRRWPRPAPSWADPPRSRHHRRWSATSLCTSWRLAPIRTISPRTLRSTTFPTP